jgi:hypothetical protein
MVVRWLGSGVVWVMLLTRVVVLFFFLSSFLVFLVVHCGVAGF